MRQRTFLLLCSAVIFLVACSKHKVNEPTRTELQFGDYHVLFDEMKEGIKANGGGAVLIGNRLQFVFTGATTDDEAGTLPYSSTSDDLGATWSTPERFGKKFISSQVRHPKQEAVFLSLFGPTKKQTVLAIGYHVRKGVRKGSYKEDVRWRPSTLLIGRREKGQSAFTYTSYPPGTFLGEQFPAGGIILPSGRILLTLWGAKKKGENWQCGVLISDDDGLTWRYRQVGYDLDLGIRNDPKMPAGFNEQTLFETQGGQLISIIRGRDKLGAVPGSPKDTWYFRSVSRDKGETWSKPEPTNLAGTGAPSSGLTLPDGSLLSVSRIPYSRTLYRLPDPKLFGLQFARSFDKGKTWKTAYILQHDPQGNPFDNYYNALNGQFIQIAPGRWMYMFGQFDVKRNIQRILTLDLTVK